MRKLLLALCLGLSLLVLPTLLINSMPVMAASLSSETVRAEVDLEDAIANFLTSIPNNYYTIQQLDKLKSIVNNKNALLVDVREPSEFNSGHIPGAINIPLRTLTQNLDKIPQNRPVILYCTTGYRTAMGVMSLKMLGYHNVSGFPPSIQGWKAAGEPLEK
ncbi:rhodanese-like domain-containing protein [Phormidium sp. LEGE 05292]|uniref:rhodanese-like domain-containing protein n=1 Tax=[Phormidium] sp. LEGE 05292 TaxID=767427 RepID=UPI00187E4924|nr:rhodanese-like domain-containing protein [Phormidium sp. LEGE 05292]MBE9224355.1 rhodanese-like domain-containing protein [Phormidium sp. LEGE 05292]